MAKIGAIVGGLIVVGISAFIIYKIATRVKIVNPPKNTVIGIIKTDGQLLYAIILNDGRWHQIADWEAIGLDGPPDPKTIEKYRMMDLNDSKIYSGYTIVC